MPCREASRTAELKLGAIVCRAGFVTRLRDINGRPADDLTDRLGYNPGRLESGFFVLLLLQPLERGDFEFAGYTHFSGGRIGKPLDDPDLDKLRPKVHSQLAATMQTSFDEYAGGFASRIPPYGMERLAKIVPHTREGDYPGGTGIFQLELIVGKEFLVAAEVSGSTWTLCDGRKFDLAAPYPQDARRLILNFLSWAPGGVP
jgi:hypothetical protein